MGPGFIQRGFVACIIQPDFVGCTISAVVGSVLAVGPTGAGHVVHAIVGRSFFNSVFSIGSSRTRSSGRVDSVGASGPLGTGSVTVGRIWLIHSKLGASVAEWTRASTHERQLDPTARTRLPKLNLSRPRQETQTYRPPLVIEWRAIGTQKAA